MRFEEATPVQIETIPVIMKGKDLIACAQTGTGKTAAYLLPVLNRLVQKQEEQTTTLVLVPTRELAIQIDQQLQGFAYFLPLTSIAAYGGNDAGWWEQQKQPLISGANVVLATPGRLLQHLPMDYFQFTSLQYLLFDEADRMLDMGVHDDIRQIVQDFPENRQTLLFSAAMPHKIRELAGKLLQQPEEMSVAMSKPAEGILQAGYVVYDNRKVALLKELL